MDPTKWLRLQWDRALAWVLVGAGAIALIISGGMGGIFLLGVGATLWLSADLRDEWRKLDRIEEALQQREALPVHVEADTL
jgi:hypothetical protein